MIYYLVLEDESIDIHPDGSSRRFGNLTHFLALLFVNRRVHAEVALPPYMYITFCFSRVNDLVDFVDKRTDAQRCVLRKLGFETWLESGLMMLIGDDNNFQKASFSCMKRLTQLSNIRIMDRYARHSSPEFRSKMAHVARWIQKWNPDVKIMVYDRTFKREQY
tara:strand:+ start:684 stop:1172 length:489 start_codon:yes stop_codon:yes gene_type:complete